MGRKTKVLLWSLRTSCPPCAKGKPVHTFARPRDDSPHIDIFRCIDCDALVKYPSDDEPLAVYYTPVLEAGN